MNRYYAFTLDAEVVDQEALYSAAFNRALEEGMSGEEAFEHFRPNGYLDSAVCLQMLLDPGFLLGIDIIESRCERL
jgi:hypothetical protein